VQLVNQSAAAHCAWIGWNAQEELIVEALSGCVNDQCVIATLRAPGGRTLAPGSPVAIPDGTIISFGDAAEESYTVLVSKTLKLANTPAANTNPFANPFKTSPFENAKPAAKAGVDTVSTVAAALLTKTQSNLLQKQKLQKQVEQQTISVTATSARQYLTGRGVLTQSTNLLAESPQRADTPCGKSLGKKLGITISSSPNQLRDAEATVSTPVQPTPEIDRHEQPTTVSTVCAPGYRSRCIASFCISNECYVVSHQRGSPSTRPRLPKLAS
jgi:hypothetical protein